MGFLPEEFDYLQWQTGKETIAATAYYPLRPELIESTYFTYRTTEDRSWLSAGLLFLESIENFTKTDCGYASVSNMGKKWIIIIIIIIISIIIIIIIIKVLTDYIIIKLLQ